MKLRVLLRKSFHRKYRGVEELEDRETKQKVEKIQKKIDNIKEIGLSYDEENTSKIIHKLQDEKERIIKRTNPVDIETTIYNSLTDFFGRYYDEGDFISQRRYKAGIYAIPYEGEEVKLYWANHDQYYVKTSEYFKNYTFTTEQGGKKVHFKLVEAESEQENNKAAEKRFFQIHEGKPFILSNDGNELTIQMEYKNGKEGKQDAYLKDITELFRHHEKEFPGFESLSVVRTKKGKSELETQLNRYTARNTFDYFIHKNLKSFLEQELDFYIKNEVLFLDDFDIHHEEQIRQNLVKAQVIRSVGRKVIAFLAQIEDFEKKLYLKKKFVIDTEYCMTLDRIPESFYPEIVANDGQRAEWVKLFHIDDIHGEILGEVSYTEPLTVDFLKANPYLVLDTAFFDADFKDRLIGKIDDLDAHLDGLMIHSENFQALRLLQERYKGQVDCIYIDPPYNTASSPILYKNNYRDSSWMSLIYDRNSIAKELVSEEGLIINAIDEAEYQNLIHVDNQIYGKSNYIGTITVKCNPQGRVSNKLNQTSEFNIIFAKCLNNIGVLNVKKQDENNKGNPVPLKRTGTNSRREDRPKRYFPMLIKDGKVSVIQKAEYDRIYDSMNKRFNDKYVKELSQKYIMEGYDVLLPHKQDGTPLVWQREYPRVVQECCNYIVKGQSIYTPGYETEIPKTLWEASVYSNPEYGTETVKHILSGYSNADVSKNTPKSYFTIEQMVSMNDASVILDYFAGSGTTGHAIINLNRKDQGMRKYILIEMGDYFDTVTKPRIERVIYSEDWKDGKPLSRKGSSHAFKYLTLESYDDTLNNIVLKKKDDSIFAGQSRLAQSYFLSYMLEQESQGSVTLLTNDGLMHPFSYQVKVTRSQEETIGTVDLVETFNYLIGLKVERNFHYDRYDADFSKETGGVVKATLKRGNRYCLKMVEGVLPSGDRALVLWRDLTGDMVKDNAVLEAYCQKKRLNAGDSEYRRIFVNGNHNLGNIMADGTAWKITLIEEEMKKRLFEPEW